MSIAAFPAYIPSPSNGVWHLGPFPIRGYALCIIVGIFAAALLADHRYRARGGAIGVINEVATWAVPFGLVGGRLYHVLTDWSEYFGKGGSPGRSLEIWKGGLGIPGAVAVGAVGGYIGCRRRGVKMPPVADCIAPGLVLAQGLGRWGNWFNQELYGRATHLPWAVRIDANHAVPGANIPDNGYGFFQPTFLYESIWDLGTALALIVLDRKYKLGHGRVFALYLVIYGLGRSWIEALRIDPAHHILGLRLNDWTSIIIVVAGVLGFLISAKVRPGRETSLLRGPPQAVDTEASIASTEASNTASNETDAELADVRLPAGDSESNAP